MLLVGVLAGLGSAAVGLPGAVAFGLLAGALDLIPSLGPTVALVVAAVVAWFESSAWAKGAKEEGGMIYKRPSTNQGKVIVTFEIPGIIWAERINLVGDFNNWDPESLPFWRDRQENWQIEIELEVGHEYRFGYLFDGDQWHDDWHADKCTTDSHGGCHSIVIARISPENQDVESWGEVAVPSDVVPLGAPSGHWESTRQIQNVV